MPRFSCRLFVVVIILGMVCRPGEIVAAIDDPPPVKAYDSGLFRGGVARTGDLGGLRMPATAELLWRLDFEEPVGNPVVADGVVYVASGETVFALKADGSAILWKDLNVGRHVGTAPTVVGDRLYVATDQGLSALTRANGKGLWDYTIIGGASGSSPLLVGGRILVGGSDGFIHAVNADGTLAWKHDIVKDAPEPPPGFDARNALITGTVARPGTMASDGVTAFLTIFDQSRIVAVDATTGERRWSYQTKGWIHAEPTVVGDDVFVSSQDKSIYCLDKATGKVRWSFPSKWRVESGVAVRDGSAYFGSCDGFFYRVDIKTGKAVWSFEIPVERGRNRFPIYSSPIVSDDTVCFGSFDGFVYALKTIDGTVRWQVKPIEGAEVCSSPATDGRVIYGTVRYDQFKKVGANALIAIAAPKP